MHRDAPVNRYTPTDESWKFFTYTAIVAHQAFDHVVEK